MISPFAAPNAAPDAADVAPDAAPDVAHDAAPPRAADWGELPGAPTRLQAQIPLKSLPYRLRSLFLFAALVLALTSLVFARPAGAQSVGKASADILNLKPNRQETPWGRLVADAVQAAGKSDIAVVNAGALRAGTLQAGEIEATDIGALLSFGEDNVVTLSLSGTQIRAALERAASAYPTGSPAFLHCSGLVASFDANAPAGKRVTSITVAGRPLDDGSTYATAMPVSLAEGAAGYFNIWTGAQARPSKVTLQDAIADYFRAKKEVAPTETPRFAPG